MDGIMLENNMLYNLLFWYNVMIMYNKLHSCMVFVNALNGQMSISATHF